MKKKFRGASGLCVLCFTLVFATPVFGQEVYTLPRPYVTANLIAAIKATAETFPGVQVDASIFVPGTTRPNNITEVVFKFAPPDGEGGGISEPWLVALFPLDQNVPIADFVVQKRFSAYYDGRYGYQGDPRVYDRLKIFLEAVYARMNQLDEP